MKCNKTVAELDWQSCSCMRWGNGEEVNAYLDWDERFYYLWFEVTPTFEDWCEKCPDIAYMLDDLNTELEKIGVQKFGSLESVNAFCAQFCGDNEPAMFYFDEWGCVCGA